MSIFVTGDTHGARRLDYSHFDGYMPRLSMSNFSEQKSMTKDDVVIILGDFGGVWYTDRQHCCESKSEQYELDWLNDRNFTTIFVPGNHENWDRLIGCTDEKILNSWLFQKYTDEDKQRLKEGYPRQEWHGGFVRTIRSSVLMAEPGVFTIDGRRFFMCGGANSHDVKDGILNPADYKNNQTFHAAYKRMVNQKKQFRVAHVSWWPQEQLLPQWEQQAYEALAAHDWNVDFICSHDCSVSDRAILGYAEQTRINKFFEYIKQNVQYKYWFFGHLHNNYTLPGNKEHLLYEQLIQIL